MSDDNVTRRDAMSKLLQIVATAAGISVIDLNELLAAEVKTLKATPSKTTVATTASSALDALKVKLSGYNQKIFESVYGKLTPTTPMDNMQLPEGVNPGGPGAMGCVVHFGGFGPGADAAAGCPSFSFCGSFGGGACPSLDTCVENVCSGQDYGGEGGDCHGVNDCNGQDCGDLNVCGENECTDQNCPNFQGCGKDKRELVSILNSYKTDPYVQDLLSHFNVNTMTELATQIDRMISQRQTITPIQLKQERLKTTITPIKP